MSTFKDWEGYKRLKERGDTNSVVDVLKNKDNGDLIVRKIIFGIEQPLYQAILFAYINNKRKSWCDLFRVYKWYRVRKNTH